MTDFIFITLPWLLIAPLSVFVLSAVCAVTKSRVLSVVNIILHAAAITALVYFGAGLIDIFATLLVSVLSSVIFGKKATEKSKADNQNTEVNG